MNLIKYIISIIQRRKILKLGPAKTKEISHGDTTAFITIKEIEKILHNENEFNKLLNPRANKAFFHDGLTFDSYMEAVRDYVEFFLQRGIVFDKTSLSRASVITGTKFKNNKPHKNRRSPMPQLAASLLLSKSSTGNHIRYDEETERYETDYIFNSLSDFTNYMTNSDLFHSRNTLIQVLGDYVEAHELRDCLLELSSDFQMHSKILALDDEMTEDLGKLQYNSYDKDNMPQKNIQRKIEFDYNNYTINPDFEKIVLSHIPKNTDDKGILAYEIYKAVCLCTQYDSGYFIKRNDHFSQNFLQRLRRKTIVGISKKDNRVICTNFSELYCYFLSKFGIKSYIIESKSPENIDNDTCHWMVQVTTDNDVIYADATNGIIDENNLNMTDMSRAKLGIEPANFRSINGRKYGSYHQHSSSPSRVQKELSEINDMIAELSDGSHTAEITLDDRLNIMKHQLSQLPASELGNYATVQYMTSLFGYLFPSHIRHDAKNNEPLASISKSLYIKEAEDTYSYFPIIYVKKETGEYNYYYYDQKTGLKQIDIETLRDCLQDSRINYVPGKENKIPGLTIDQELYQNTSDTYSVQFEER